MSIHVKPFSMKAKIFLTVVSVAAVVFGYAHLSRRATEKNPNQTTIPGLHKQLEGVKELCMQQENEGNVRWIVEDSKATFERLGYGLLWGVCFSLLIGMGMGCSRIIEGLFWLPLSVFAQVPATAMMALFYVIFGLGLKMFSGMICYGILPPLAQTIYLAVKDVHQDQIFKAQTLGASTGEIVWVVIFKQIIPKIINSIRITFPLAFLCLIAAEYANAGVGFGYRIRVAAKQLQNHRVIPLLILLGLIGILVTIILKKLPLLTSKWYEEGRS